MVLLQIFLHAYILILNKDKDVNQKLIFPSVSSVNSNWFPLHHGSYVTQKSIFPSISSVNSNGFPLNCGSFLTHCGCATQLEELGASQAGAGTGERTWAGAKMLRYEVFSHRRLLSLLLQMVFLSPLPSPLPSGLFQGLISIEETLLWFRGRWELGLCYTAACTENQNWCFVRVWPGMIVEIYKELYGGVISRRRLATSSHVRVNKSILAFPVSSFIGKDAYLCFKA